VCLGSVSKWVKRFKAEGEDGLHDRSSRPHRRPTRTGDVEMTVLAAALSKRAPGYVSLGFAPPSSARVITAETWIE